MEKRRVLGEEVMEWGKRKMKREVFKENRGEVCHGVVTSVLIVVISFFNSSHLTHLPVVSQFLMLSSPIALLPSNGSFYEENKKQKYYNWGGTRVRPMGLGLGLGLLITI